MGNGPSLKAAIQKRDWETTRSVLRSANGRERAQTKRYDITTESVTALHLACRHRAPADVIQNLIGIGSPSHASSPGRLTPLHYAMMAKQPITSPRVVRILLDAFPDDVVAQCATASSTPLHIACQRLIPHDIIRMLHEADPSACGIRDAAGQTPLDLAQMHLWIRYPIWRRRVHRILTEGPPERITVPVAATATTNHHLPHPTTQPPPVAVATLVSDNTNEPPMAAAVLETIGPIPSAPPEDQLDVCVLCWDHGAEVALVPCGHVCLCSQCCEQPQVLNAALQRKCPVCRQPFTQTLKIYQAGISTI